MSITYVVTKYLLSDLASVFLDASVYAKGWMVNVIPALHDHLKRMAMFYKEWSSDSFWLPQNGLSLLPEGRCCM